MLLLYRPTLLICLLALVFPLTAAKKKKPEVTQVLELPKDLPPALVVETQHLSFQSSPLVSKGLLSAQIREGIKSLWKQHHGAQIVRLRAFVAGSGDSRRVQAIVSEEFSGHKQPLPVLTVVQVGALPQDLAQVALESIAVEKKVVNPNGLIFLAGQQVLDPNPEAATGPMLTQSLERLTRLVPGADLLSVTCYASVLPGPAVRDALAATVPRAAFQLVQARREAVRGLAECEGVARGTGPSTGLKLEQSGSGYSQIAIVNTPRVILSGAQLGFQNSEADIRLAFSRLEKALEHAGGSLQAAAEVHTYPLHASIAEKILNVRGSFLDKAHPPASTLVSVEGLPSLDAAFAIDAIVVKRD